MVANLVGIDVAVVEGQIYLEEEQYLDHDLIVMMVGHFFEKIVHLEDHLEDLFG